MASIVLIHWLGAALGAWPLAAVQTQQEIHTAGRGWGVSAMLPEGGKNAEKMKKMAHIYRCCGFIPHFTQQTQDNNIHTLTTNMITEKRSNIFVLALSITPLVKKKKK